MGASTFHQLHRPRLVGRRYTAAGTPQRAAVAADERSRRILKDGFVVTAIAFVYFAIPLVVMAKLLEWSGLEQLRELIVLVWNILLQRPHESMGSFLLKEAFHLLANSTAPVVYLAFATPMFVAARLRYALTGQLRSFFNLLGNLIVCFRHLGGMLLYVFLSTVTSAAIAFLGAILVWTGIGLVVPIVLGAANIWILAYLAGNLAAEMYQQDGIGRAMFARAAAPPVAADAHLRNPAPATVDNPPRVPDSAGLPDLLKPNLAKSELAREAPAQSISSALVLYCRKGPLTGDTFPAPVEGFYIGRSPHLSHLIVESREVSSRHAFVALNQQAGGIWLQDLNSSNGTFYRTASGDWQPVRGRQHLGPGGRFQLSRGAAEFEVAGR